MAGSDTDYEKKNINKIYPAHFLAVFRRGPPGSDPGNLAEQNSSAIPAGSVDFVSVPINSSLPAVIQQDALIPGPVRIRILDPGRCPSLGGTRVLSVSHRSSKDGAADTTFRGTAMAELESMTPRKSQHVPGEEILARHWMYRLAKKYFFHDFGAYAKPG